MIGDIGDGIVAARNNPEGTRPKYGKFVLLHEAGPSATAAAVHAGLVAILFEIRAGRRLIEFWIKYQKRETRDKYNKYYYIQNLPLERPSHMNIIA